jgi:hypothetical protein
VKLHALTVSVDYGPELARSIDRWVSGLEQLVVVTAPRDEETIALARRAGADLHVTEAFWEDGAHFAKSRAMQEARALLPSEGWHLFIDADVVPPEGWRTMLEAQAPQPGTLHGARRVFEDGRQVGDRELAGFFQLFHAADARGAAPLGCEWTHAGCYDSEFMLRWPRAQQRILDLELVHLGETGRNWCGRGNEAALEEIRRQRRAGRSWRTETVGRVR